MSTIAILTPDPADASYTAIWQRSLSRLQAAFSAGGVEAVPEPWTAHADNATGLRSYGRVLPLLAWGYHLDHARWLRACATWARDGVAVANPPRVLAWNSDKRYLAELQARGVSVPRTVGSDAFTAADLDAAFAATGAEELILKPAVSGGAYRTRRLRRGDAPDAPDGTVMLLQPYLPTIATEGETSLLYFGGRLSHVVNKRPAAGEFRVQEQFGGEYRLLERAPAAALALAEQVFAAIDAPLLYARIDMVPDADGRWLLMEAELIEPDFYLGVDPRRGAGLAEAVRALG